MKAARIAELRQMAKGSNIHGGVRSYVLGASEVTEMLDAVEGRKPKKEGFTAWLMELETTAGRAYRAREIKWFRENAFAKGLTPLAALDLCGDNCIPSVGAK